MAGTERVVVDRSVEDDGSMEPSAGADTAIVTELPTIEGVTDQPGFDTLPELSRDAILSYVRRLMDDCEAAKMRCCDLEEKANSYHDTLLQDRPDYEALLSERTAEIKAQKDEVEASMAAVRAELEALKAKPGGGEELDKLARLVDAAVEEIADLETIRGEHEKLKGRVSELEGHVNSRDEELKRYDDGFEDVIRFALAGHGPELADIEDAPEEFLMLVGGRPEAGDPDGKKRRKAYADVVQSMIGKRGLRKAMPAQLVLSATSGPDAGGHDSGGEDYERMFPGDPLRAGIVRAMAKMGAVPPKAYLPGS